METRLSRQDILFEIKRWEKRKYKRRMNKRKKVLWLRYLLALARVLILILIQNLVNIIGNIFIFIVCTKIKYIYFLYVQTQNIFKIWENSLKQCFFLLNSLKQWLANDRLLRILFMQITISIFPTSTSSPRYHLAFFRL